MFIVVKISHRKFKSSVSNRSDYTFRVYNKRNLYRTIDIVDGCVKREISYFFCRIIIIILDNVIMILKGFCFIV